MNVRDFYKNKTIMLSGCTGFVGKVVLEKILRTCPEFKKIFVMMRSKKGISSQERLQKEILSSELFNGVFQQQANLRNEIATKVIGVSGDLIIPKLGIEGEIRSTIVNELDILINCAASVNFDDPLLDAIQINYMGGLRMLELAKECKHLEVFTHVSTAYANCDQPSGSFVEEKVYDIQEDPEQVISNIQKMNPQHIAENEKSLIGDYPNTYTFTKSMAERVLKKRRGNIKLMIYRPSIIMSNYEDPLEGWTDTIAAAGGLTMAFALGIMHFINANSTALFDLIPCDFVSNGILVATCYTARQPPQLHVYHSATTKTNPLYLSDYQDCFLKGMPWYTFEKQVGNPYGSIIDNQYLYRLLIFLTADVPMFLAKKYAQLPLESNIKFSKDIAQLDRIQTKMSGMQGIFNHFINNMWIFDSKMMTKLIENMSDDDLEHFEIDTRKIDWYRAISSFLFGIKRYFMKEEFMAPETGFKQVLTKNVVPFFHDIRSSFDHDQHHRKDTRLYESRILQNQSYAEFMNSRIVEKSNSPQFALNMDLANKQFSQMRACFDRKYIQIMIWFLNKRLRVALEYLFVDMKGLDKVKDLTKPDSPHQVVLMPIYKSYADFFLLNYVFYTQQMELPFFFGNEEDTPRIMTADRLISRSGYIRMSRKEGQSFQEQYINSSLLRHVIEHNKMTVLFQNSERLRSGKLTMPVRPQYAVEWLLDAFNGLSGSRKNIVVVPVAINYERIFEIANIAKQMMSGIEKNITIFEVIQKINFFKKGELGTVYIKFGEAINLKEHLEKKNSLVSIKNHIGLQETSMQLTQDLLRMHQQQTTVNLNMIVCAFLLQGKDQEISLKTLHHKTKMIQQYIQYKQQMSTAVSYMSVVPSEKAIETVVKHQKFFKIKNQNSKDCKVEMKKILNTSRNVHSLAHYSIALSSIFVLEGCICHVVKRLKQNIAMSDPKAASFTISIDQICQNVKMFAEIFQNEYLFSYTLTPERILQHIEFLANVDLIKIQEQNQTIMVDTKSKNYFMIDFFYNLVRPFVDTYLIVLLLLEKICGKILVLKQKTLIKELHESIKNLHRIGIIKHEHSCLHDILSTSLGRYQQLGIVDVRTYINKWGSQRSYLQCTSEMKSKISETHNILSQLRRLTTKEARTIDSELDNTIQNIQGPYHLAKL